MRLFHVSEEANIKEFNPRTPYRKDISQEKGLVWALCERSLPNFFTPRDCPRVTFHKSAHTQQEDIDQYFSSKDSEHSIFIEKDWLKKMAETTLTIYEFNPKNFTLQDEIAGYYVSHHTEKPIATYTVHNLRQALRFFDIEFHVVDELWEIMHEIQNSTFNWSMCRMDFAKNQQNKKKQ